MAIRLALLDVALDETAWAALDTAGALPRAPAELVIVVESAYERDLFRRLLTTAEI